MVLNCNPTVGGCCVVVARYRFSILLDEAPYLYFSWNVVCSWHRKILWSVHDTGENVLVASCDSSSDPFVCVAFMPFLSLCWHSLRQQFVRSAYSDDLRDFFDQFFLEWWKIFSRNHTLAVNYFCHLISLHIACKKILFICLRFRCVVVSSFRFCILRRISVKSISYVLF